MPNRLVLLVLAALASACLEPRDNYICSSSSACTTTLPISVRSRRTSRSPYPQAGRRRQPRACLGLFAAADALGFGFVHGVPPHIYMERLEPAVLEKWGLSIEGADHSPDGFIRIPGNPEAVFRAAVVKDEVPCADILQVWLDVSEHPARGRAQADEIARRALGPLLRKK